MRGTIARVRALVARVRALPKKVIIPTLLVLLALVSFGTYKAMNAYSYMEDNPNFCRACHTMEKAWTRWETSVHRSVSCHECHKSDVIDDAMLLIKFSLSRPDDVDKHAVVRDEACQKCHESGNPRWVQVADTAGHKVHAEEQNIACTKCHAVTVHQFVPPGPICTVCHEDKHIAVNGMSEMHCTACHNYTSSEEELLPQRKDCLDCHLSMTKLGVTWPEYAPMQFPCSDCHKPHEQAKPVANCLSCHANIPTQGLHVGAVHAASTCQTCHQPHEWQTVARETCATCHVDRAEHNVGTSCATCHAFVGPAFTPASPTPTPTAPLAGTPAGTPKPAGPPTVPHPLEGRSDCTACHGLAGFKPFPQDHVGRTSTTCLACHQKS